MIFYILCSFYLSSSRYVNISKLAVFISHLRYSTPCVVVMGKGTQPQTNTQNPDLTNHSYCAIIWLGIKQKGGQLPKPDRLDVGDGDSIPMTVAAIQPGDYIRSQLNSHIVGRVVRRGTLAGYPAFIIENYRGILGVVVELDTMILGLADVQNLEQRLSEEFDKS